ncbi:MAG TPA: hypothetical protein VKB18_05280 [Gemmatimonadota bacterium]|nr:hypothetical protein [Gemmatimonadota bacterium]
MRPSSRGAWTRAVPVLVWAALAVTAVGCGGSDGSRGGRADAGAAGADTSAAASREPGPAGGSAARTASGGADQQATFSVEAGVLVRREGGKSRPLLALDSAEAPAGVPVVPGTWKPAPGSSFGVEASSFRHVAPSPDGAWVAWETDGVHELLGVVPADGGRPAVLDFFFDSHASELTWAAGGPYLAARYLPPSGREELRVYDAARGARLQTPWGEACRPRDGCAVASAEWTGPTTLTVRTEGGGKAGYRVDVTRLPPMDGAGSGS